MEVSLKCLPSSQTELIPCLGTQVGIHWTKQSRGNAQSRENGQWVQRTLLCIGRPPSWSAKATQQCSMVFRTHHTT